jgi:hypothetical protein
VCLFVAAGPFRKDLLMPLRLAIALFVTTLLISATAQGEVKGDGATLLPIAAGGSAQAAFGAALDDGWRRTAHGWERMSDWPSEYVEIALSLPSATSSLPPTGLAAVNPIAFAAVQGMLGVFVLLLGRRTVRSTSVVVERRQTIGAPHCRPVGQAVSVERRKSVA